MYSETDALEGPTYHVHVYAHDAQLFGCSGKLAVTSTSLMSPPPLAVTCLVVSQCGSSIHVSVVTHVSKQREKDWPHTCYRRQCLERGRAQIHLLHPLLDACICGGACAQTQTGTGAHSC